MIRVYDEAGNAIETLVAASGQSLWLQRLLLANNYERGLRAGQSSPGSGCGSMEFTLGGYGGPISSDSYIGVRYFPKNPIGSPPGWTQTLVSSLDSTKLPQENGSVAIGLYVVAIEPEWFIFCFEYQE